MRTIRDSRFWIVTTIVCSIQGCSDSPKSGETNKTNEIPTLEPASAEKNSSKIKISDQEKIRHSGKDFTPELEAKLADVAGKTPLEKRDEVIYEFLKETEFGELEGLAKAIRGVESAYWRERILVEKGRLLSLRNPTKFYEQASEFLTGKDRNRAQNLAVMALLQSGRGKDASRYAEKMSFSKERLDTLADVAVNWIKTEPSLAYEWIKSLDSKEDRLSVIRAASYSILETNGLQGFADIRALTKDSNIIENAVIKAVPIAVSQGGIDGAVTWIGTLEAEFRGVAISQLAQILPVEQSASWGKLVSLASSPQQQLELTHAITLKLAKRDPTVAVDWVKSLPPPLRQSGYTIAANQWYEQDSEALFNWLNQMPDQSERDAVYESLANQLAPKNRENALAVARGIGNQATRERVVSYITRK